MIGNTVINNVITYISSIISFGNIHDACCTIWENTSWFSNDEVPVFTKIYQDMPSLIMLVLKTPVKMNLLYLNYVCFITLVKEVKTITKSQ